MVVGRGTNDPDANANVSKVARMLWEGMGFGWTEVAYSGVAYPLVDEGLRHAVRLGYRRIIVFPYFLFTGILVDRIYAHADACAAAHPEIEIVKADYLNDHPLVIDTFVERLGEALNGANLMNCLLCKYREQVLGYEADQGAPQVGHHFHVRGIGTDERCTAMITGTGTTHHTGTAMSTTHGHDHDHDHALHAHPSMLSPSSSAHSRGSEGGVHEGIDRDAGPNHAPRLRRLRHGRLERRRGAGERRRQHLDRRCRTR